MKFPGTYSLAASLLAGLLVFGAQPLAQDARQQGQAAGQPPAVMLSVLVLDKKKQPVADLRREDFQVFEGDEPQTISFFSKEEVPVSYGLLIDSSGSLKSKFPAITEAGRLIIQGGREGDEAFLVRFVSTEKIELAQDFTSDRDAILGQLASFQTELGQTALLDALYAAADHLRKTRPADDFTRRRALILVSDGEDRRSQYEQEAVIELLRKSNIQVFAIGLVKDLDRDAGLREKSPREKAIKLLEELANETGGRAFIVESSSELREAALEIPRHLHSQYVIGYDPAGRFATGAYRKARVKVVDAPGRDKFKAIVRAGYNAR